MIEDFDSFITFLNVNKWGVNFVGGGGGGGDISWKPTAAPTSQKKIKAFMNPYLTIEISSRSI